jgi:hypothetical protein
MGPTGEWRDPISESVDLDHLAGKRMSSNRCIAPPKPVRSPANET